MHGWNVMATSLNGNERPLLRLMNELGEFERSSCHNLLVGHVDDLTAFLEGLKQRYDAGRRLPMALGRALPVDATVQLKTGDPEHEIEQALQGLIGRIAGHSYHVRVERRGHKGQIHTSELEKLLGDFIWDQVERRGMKPRVDFDDPEVVVAVEIVGDEAGISLVERSVRERYPFVRIR